MYNAYMIRNDGKEIPVKIHPYGNPEVVEETLYASQWLYQNTKNKTTKDMILCLIRSFAFSELGATENVKEQLINWVSGLKYIVLTEDFIESLPDLDDVPIADTNTVNQLVCDELNQEFLRARLGGLVNSFVGSKEMVFRVSSVGFNWFNIIYMFVNNNKREISSVTIVKDEETTGYENYFYSYKGEVYDRMPIDEFLTQSGNPIVESAQYKQLDNLSSGYSILESFGNINYERMHEAVIRLHNIDIKNGVYVNGRI